MIKMHYKKISIALAMLGFIASNSVSMVNLADAAPPTEKTDKAQAIQEKKAEIQAIKAENVCERISNFAENLNSKASEAEDKVNSNQQNRLKNWTEKTKQADANLERLRTNWSKNRDEQFSKLEEAAKTDEQKKAVSDFETTTKKAITTRQAAVDAANKAFRDGVQELIMNRQDKIDSLVSGFVSARKEALDKVQADCSASKDAKTIRADFQAALKTVRTQFQSDRQDVAKVGNQIQALIQVRRTAVEKAMGDFKNVMEQARVTLRKAFPTDTTDVDSSATDTDATTTDADTGRSL